MPNRPCIGFVFDPNVCASPCPRFLPGRTDEHGMVACIVCEHWFLDDDPTVAEYDEREPWGGRAGGPALRRAEAVR